MRQHLTLRTLKQFFGYGAVGLLNTALNFICINIGIVLIGTAQGPAFLWMSFAVFTVLVLHSFVWNRSLIFVRDNPRELHREYISFFLVTGFSSLLNLVILHILVDIVGAPHGMSMHLWANVALAITIPVSVVLNFLGYKLFVFREQVV